MLCELPPPILHPPLSPPLMAPSLMAWRAASAQPELPLCSTFLKGVPLQWQMMLPGNGGFQLPEKLSSSIRFKVSGAQPLTVRGVQPRHKHGCCGSAVMSGWLLSVVLTVWAKSVAVALFIDPQASIHLLFYSVCTDNNLFHSLFYIFLLHNRVHGCVIIICLTDITLVGVVNWALAPDQYQQIRLFNLE